jgi:DNA-binding transcriptional LysR family regulator
MSELKQMQAFIEVVETGSFTKAANKMGISATAVSKSVRGLEDNLGITLLTRTTRHVLLTELGNQCYERYRTILTGVNEIKEMVTASKTEPAGLLRISSAVSFSEPLLTYIKNFVSLYPKVTIELEISDSLPNLEKDKIDLLVGFHPEYVGNAQPNLLHSPIFQTKGILCASSNYLALFGEPQKPEELSEHRHVIHNRRQQMDSLLLSNPTTKKEISVPIKGIMWINDSRAILTAGIKGIGIIYVADYLARNAIQNGLLKEILAPYTQRPITMYAYYLNSPYISSTILKFKDGLKNFAMT